MRGITAIHATGTFSSCRLRVQCYLVAFSQCHFRELAAHKGQLSITVAQADHGLWWNARLRHLSIPLMHDPSENPPPSYASTSANRSPSDSLRAADTAAAPPIDAPPIVAPPIVVPPIVAPSPTPPATGAPTAVASVAPTTVAPFTLPPAQTTAVAPTAAAPTTIVQPSITNAAADDNSDLFKGNKRLHEEEQTMPIRDSDGNTRPFPVTDPNEIRRRIQPPRPLPLPPRDQAATNSGASVVVPSQAIIPAQRAANPVHLPSIPQVSHRSTSAGSRATRQLPSRRLTSPPTGPSEPINSALTPLYASVSPSHL